jgi:hypothetical protein
MFDGRGEEAMTLMETALVLLPEHPPFISNLAMARLLAGRPQQAVETARVAQSHATGDRLPGLVIMLAEHVLDGAFPCPRSACEIYRR